MKLLKRFEEPIADKFIVAMGPEVLNRFLTIDETRESLTEAPSDYTQFVLRTLEGKSLTDFKHCYLKACFIQRVENKFLGPVPRYHLHGCYTKHVNPFDNVVLDVYLVGPDISDHHSDKAVMEEITRLVRSIRKPVLTVLSYQLFVWVNQLLFNYSSRLLKVDFTVESRVVTATLRYVNPGETNQDIVYLCRRDTRLNECYQDIATGNILYRVISNYLRCGGYLNINQLLLNEKAVTYGSVMSRINEMKQTGYPGYATLQTGLATLGNVFKDPVKITGLTQLEKDVLMEAVDYTPWVCL